MGGDLATDVKGNLLVLQAAVASGRKREEKRGDSR